MLARAVSVGSKLNFWKTKPILWRRTAVNSASVMSAISLPSMRTLPAVGFVIAPRICISDDLPQPDGPMIAVNSPSRTRMLTPRRASTSTFPTLYVFRRSIVSSKIFIYKDLTYKFVSQTLLVSECFDRILTRCLERGVKGTNNAAQYRKDRCFDDPIVCDFDHHRREGGLKDSLYQEAAAGPKNHTQDAHHCRF